MAIPPRKIRQLPPALPPKDSDVFPISQMGEDGRPTTRAMSRGQNNADMIEVINAARQDFVNAASAEHAAINARIDNVQLTPGPKGDKGEITKWKTGVGSPSVQGNPEDMYLDTATGDIWKYI